MIQPTDDHIDADQLLGLYTMQLWEVLLTFWRYMMLQSSRVKCGEGERVRMRVDWISC
jgi:hypothetical protein